METGRFFALTLYERAKNFWHFGIASILRRWRKWRNPKLSEYTDEYLEYFNHLFNRAADTSGFNFLYTILRVEGITSGHWDAFVEAEDAAMDFSKLLRKIGRSNPKRSLRMALFLYCHSTEMSAPYEIIANLLRGCADRPFMMYPFAHLVRVERSRSVFAKRHLPYPRKRIAHIKQLAAVVGEEKIGEVFDGFFNNDVRNAFYHSDYAISEDEFRIVKGGDIGRQVIPLTDLSDMLSRCFAFYSAFFIAYNQARRALASGSRFMRMSNYEVLELLSGNEGLTGFKIHFPNGGHAMFERKKYGGTTGLNFMVEEEGISLNVGELSSYNNATDWMVEGRPFEQLGTRYNRTGRWFPIVFRRNSEPLKRKAMSATTDKVVQGCLFYIYATGHRSIEFVIKSNESLFTGEQLSFPRWSTKKRIVIEKVDRTTSGFNLYDGTFYLNDDQPDTVAKGIEQIHALVNSLSQTDPSLRFRLKYQLYGDASSYVQEPGEDGSFTIVLRMDDPRHTMVASDLTMFPRSDWKIKEEWI